MNPLVGMELSTANQPYVIVIRINNTGLNQREKERSYLRRSESKFEESKTAAANIGEGELASYRQSIGANNGGINNMRQRSAPGRGIMA